MLSKFVLNVLKKFENADYKQNIQLYCNISNKTAKQLSKTTFYVDFQYLYLLNQVMTILIDMLQHNLNYVESKNSHLLGCGATLIETTINL